jgi:hypothetical protein
MLESLESHSRATPVVLELVHHSLVIPNGIIEDIIICVDS